MRANIDPSCSMHYKCKAALGCNGQYQSREYAISHYPPPNHAAVHASNTAPTDPIICLRIFIVFHCSSDYYIFQLE
ncbi:hypothetical protein L2E82_16480 [Cichorium intybus]|uniref:Uncharacterized protein n=1 Tax=Cichorium intybus TaxID=13427 RepID=A0ACB9F6A3_CICIN|nr:hypothetical protein L2E82_16480 [Cichorium intybus]